MIIPGIILAAVDSRLSGETGERRIERTPALVAAETLCVPVFADGHQIKMIGDAGPTSEADDQAAVDASAAGRRRRRARIAADGVEGLVVVDIVVHFVVHVFLDGVDGVTGGGGDWVAGVSGLFAFQVQQSRGQVVATFVRHHVVQCRRRRRRRRGWFSVAQRRFSVLMKWLLPTTTKYLILLQYPRKVHEKFVASY